MIAKLPPLPHAGEYRKDGWPLCPRCGSDELAVLDAPLEVCQGKRKTLATDPLRCLYCRWEGTVPAKGKT